MTATDRAGDMGAEGSVLLTTKLHPPRRRRTLVARPRLRDLATRRGHPALTLVSAPAGFGKTTLVADWFAGERTTAWLSIDARDDDPEQFWTYVLAALSTVTPELVADTAPLLRSGRIPLETVVATLINDLETASQDIVLVLDDYHVITAPEIHDSVTFLLEHLPPQLSLVIVTRADPPLPLASLRAEGALHEVRAADLRFTADEAAEYLNGAMELTLTTTDVDVLEARTEGWIAALQLAALSMQGRSDPASFISEFAGDDRFILDYLADEVLERQTARIRDFLFDTSILSRLTGPLCAAVTGQDDAKSILDELDRSNMFLVPLDDRRTWYRYHHLFGDVVRARLLDEQPDRVAELHRRASDWYAGNGDPHEAIAHALAGDDTERAAELIELAAPAMQRARHESQLRAWLEALPADIYEDRPVLAMALIGARMATGESRGLDPLLEIVDSWLQRTDSPIVFDDVTYGRLPAMAAVHRAGLALLAGDTNSTIEHAHRVLELAGSADHLQRGAAMALTGLAHWSRGNLDDGRTCYTESVVCFETGDYLPDVMGCSLALADIQITQGRLSDAQRTFESALRHTVDHPGLRGAADMHVGLSLLAIEHDDLDIAAAQLRASAELGEHMGLPQHPYRWRVATARLHEAQGDLDKALELLTQAEALYDTDYSPRVRPVSASKARIEVKRGDLDAGARWADAQGLSPHDELSYVREFEHITLAGVLLARRSAHAVEQAAGLLRRLLTAAADGHRDGSAIEILVLLALAESRAGDDAAATMSLSRALALAEPQGYVRSFLDADPALTDLLRPLAVSDGYAARILASARPAALRRRSRSTGPDQLSDRELDVLRLLRSDLSGPEVARELHVSLNTLRTHTKHIYTKLGATNRREAVTRAAELGL
jgi:LuxR family transcriptional regulator, maltose regulon positive regulatory protein